MHGVAQYQPFLPYRPRLRFGMGRTLMTRGKWRSTVGSATIARNFLPRAAGTPAAEDSTTDRLWARYALRPPPPDSKSPSFTRGPSSVAARPAWASTDWVSRR